VTHDNEDSLQNQTADYVAAAAKSILGIVPFAGSLLVELVGIIIPNQRVDRIAKFAAALQAKLTTLDQEFVRAKLTDENFSDLMEEGLRQAARSLSDERREYIASVICSGLSSEEIQFAEAKHMLKILGEISDVEVIWLRYYLVTTKGADDAYRAKHTSILTPLTVYPRAPSDIRDKAALQYNYKERLCQLGLLERRYETDPQTHLPIFDSLTGNAKVHGYQITALGRLLLRQIGLKADE